MHAIFLVMVLGADPAALPPLTPVVSTDSRQAAIDLESKLSTGSLLFSQGDCLAIKTFTRSPFTHVAVIVARTGQPTWVYDSQNGVGVRKSLLAEYMTLVEGTVVTILTPVRPFAGEEENQLVGSLEQALGTPYGVVHHLTGRRAAGMHCAEYLTDALIAAERIVAECPPRVSPASLRNGLLRHELYEQRSAVIVLAPIAERAPGRNWCEELWLDTKDCCRTSWHRFNGCVLCRG